MFTWLMWEEGEGCEGDPFVRQSAERWRDGVGSMNGERSEGFEAFEALLHAMRCYAGRTSHAPLAPFDGYSAARA